MGKFAEVWRGEVRWAEEKGREGKKRMPSGGRGGERGGGEEERSVKPLWGVRAQACYTTQLALETHSIDLPPG